MTGPSDAPDEMTSFDEIDDAYAERLLRTRGLAAGSRDDAAALFISAVADLANTAPAPSAALARLLEEGFVPAPAPVPPPAPAAAPRRSGWRTSRTLLAGVLAGTTLVGLASGATAGLLPGPLQDRVGGLLEATTPFEFPLPDRPAAPPREPRTPLPDRRVPAPPAPATPETPLVDPPGPIPAPLAPPVPDLVGEPDPVAPTAPQQAPPPGSPPGMAPGPGFAPPRDDPGPPAPPVPPVGERPAPGPPQEPAPRAGARGATQQQPAGYDSGTRVSSSDVSSSDVSR